MDHAQVCKLSGFIYMYHNEVTDFVAACMKELDADVEVESMLQLLTGESFNHRTANTEPNARADVRVRGFWTQSRNAFFDTRVFYSYTSSYRSRPLTSVYRQLESKKKYEYGERE